MINKLLPRDEFRESVFKRDGYCCVVCKSGGKLDAHHIMERRLFDDGGYYINNGATLCEPCHILAEQTKISPKELYEKIGIEKYPLPDDFYDDYEYTKWGDICLSNGTRLKGPLFFDESVQKILKSGGFLESYSKYVKYQRTYHLPWSESKTNDDRTLENTEHLKGKNVVVTVKMDGENTTIYSDGYCHARSVDAESHWTQSYVRNLAGKIGYELPDGWRICGENLYAKHSIKYTDLEDYFLMFSIWNEKNICLSWKDTIEWSQLLGLKTVPVLYQGIYDESLIKNLWNDIKNNHEGYIIRLENSFNYSMFKKSVAKFVRLNHVQTSHHWKRENIEKNNLK